MRIFKSIVLAARAHSASRVIVSRFGSAYAAHFYRNGNCIGTASCNAIIAKRLQRINSVNNITVIL